MAYMLKKRVYFTGINKKYKHMQQKAEHVFYVVRGRLNLRMAGD